MSELISVIVPVYNVENYLRQCLDSILSQTYEHLEIILVNDGSTDKSGQICAEYEERDARVRVITTSQQFGPSHSRNLGLDNMTGAYVTFIDSDDWVDKDYVKVMYEQIIGQEADIALVDYCRFNDDTGVFYIHNFDEAIVEFDKDAYFTSLFEAKTNNFVVAWGKLFKSSLFHEGLLIRFPFGRVGEDKWVTHLLFMKSKKNIFIKKTFYCWRHRSGSLIKRVDISSSRDDFEGSKQRLLDCILAGQSVEEALNYYRQHLYIKKAFIEAQGQVSTEFYREVLTSIALLERKF